jgi:hypothetical protein
MENKKIYKTAIVVQFFIKANYLQEIIDKLLQQPNIQNCLVIFWQDHIFGSKYFNSIEDLNNCKEIVSNNLHKFKNAIRRKNKINKGTCKTCQIALDYAFQFAEYAILLEDDVIPSHCFLSFFEYFIQKQKLSFENKFLFITGESVFFDSRDYELNESKIQLAKKLIEKYHLNKYYWPLKFVPSSCFCTSSSIWEKVGEIRGGPTGDEDLTKYLKENRCKTISPVVPCCKDVGMLDKKGYSVMLHGQGNIREIKNTYLLNNSNKTAFCFFRYNTDKLFHLVSKMNITKENMDLE